MKYLIKLFWWLFIFNLFFDFEGIFDGDGSLQQKGEQIVKSGKELIKDKADELVAEIEKNKSSDDENFAQNNSKDNEVNEKLAAQSENQEIIAAENEIAEVVNSKEALEEKQSSISGEMLVEKTEATKKEGIYNLESSKFNQAEEFDGYKPYKW